jgi:hypothetical protein
VIEDPNDPAVLVALQKGIAKKLEDVVLQPGTYPINAEVTLKIEGTIQRGEDGCRSVAPKMPVALFLALILKRAKFDRDMAKKVLAQCLTKAIEADGEIDEAIKDRVTDAQATIDEVNGNHRVTQQTAGATKWMGEVEIVE